MKLLREYIRGLLNERKTDVQYSALIDAIISAMKSGTHFADVGAEFGVDGNGLVWKVYEMKEMPLPVEGSDFAPGFEELFVTIINPKKDPTSRYMREQAGMTPDDELQMYPSPPMFEKLKKVKNPLGYLASEFSSLLEHELTHQINKVRSGGKMYRSAGGDDQFDVSKQAYLDSTEEIQARLIPVISSVRKAVDDDEGYTGDKLRAAIEAGDFRDFQKYLFDLNHAALHLGKVSEKTKQRYIKRLYSLFQELEDETAS